MAVNTPAAQSDATASRTRCETCKNRRIKCDGALPVCQRCVKSRRECIKISSTKGALFIHFENPYVTGLVKRPRGPRVSLIPARPLDLRTRARGYYLNHHLHTPSDVKLMGSVQESIGRWASVTADSIVDMAISSMALAIFSRIQQHPPAAAEACESYGRLLRTARVAMPDLVRRDVDGALVAVFLMGRYEDSMHDPGSAPAATAFKSYSHHDGASAILKVWLERRGSDGEQEATDVIRHSRRGILRSAFLRYQAVPPWLEDGAQFGEYGLELEYDRLLVSIASLRQRLKMLQLQSLHRGVLARELRSWAQDLSVEAGELSKALRAWATRVPSAWSPRRHLIPPQHPLPREHLYSSIVYSYSSLAHATIWMNYYATSMLLERARLRILELVRPLSDDLCRRQQHEEEDCCLQIQEMAAALSSSIPFTLGKWTGAEDAKSLGDNPVITTLEGEVKPYLASLVAWPLSLAASITGLDAEQRNWFKSELSSIGRVVGVGALFDSHSHDWLDL